MTTLTPSPCSRNNIVRAGSLRSRAKTGQIPSVFRVPRCPPRFTLSDRRSRATTLGFESGGCCERTSTSMQFSTTRGTKACAHRRLALRPEALCLYAFLVCSFMFLFGRVSVDRVKMFLLHGFMTVALEAPTPSNKTITRDG